MRIALLSALVLAAVTLLPAAASAQQRQMSAKQAYAMGDYALALGKWRAAAARGDAKAQVNLGRMYALGHGVAKDEAAAIAWFRKAADQDSAVAHHNLGVMYETGARPDLEAAAEHYRIAAEDGWTESQTALAKLYQHGRGVERDYRQAARWLEPAARDNDAEAQFLLGVFYANGWGVERDLGEMLRWTRRSARQGHRKALFHIGWAYDRGLGVGRDPAAAARFYAVAAKKGDARAQSRLGEMYFDGIGVKQSHEAAFALLIRAAAAGEAAAQYLLGHAYHAGKGVPRNAERAVAYYRRAAEGGHLDARIKLALAYDSGDGVAENPKKALEWYRLAAAAGDALSQYSIGLAYLAGRGIAKDEAEAARWFLKAARRGHDDAQLALARMYRDGIGVARNDRAALRWVDEAVRAGNAVAIADLAELHLAGRGVARDPARALELLRQAAGKGLRSAQTRLADLLADGTRVARDLARAAKWYRLLAENGDAHGTSMLATFYLEGEGGLTRDAKRAVELFRIAANLGSAHAANMLATLHADGRGVEKSYAKAAQWYQIAASKGDDAAHYALASLYRHGLGVDWDPIAAERHYQSALAIRERRLGAESLELTDVLLRLAELSHYNGPSERAVSYYRRAAAILRGVAGREAAYLEALTGLAAIFRDLGRLGAADEAVSRALKSLGPGSEETAAVLKLGLAELYESLGRDARAVEVYGDVLAMMKRGQGSGPGYRHALAARGRVLARLGRGDEAEADFIPALTLMEKHGSGGFASHHARALSDYGRLLTRRGLFGEAVATFEKAEGLIDGIGLRQHPRGLAGAADFALAYERRGKLDSAISVLRRAARGHARRARRMASASAADAWPERSLVYRTFLRYARLLTEKPASPARVAEAFEAAQEARILGLAPARERIVARLSRGDDALGRLLDARRRAIAGWRRMERRLVGAQAGSGRVEPKVLRRGFRRLRALDREVDRLEARLAEDFPRVAALLSPAPVGIDEARRLLGPGEALVATLSGRRETHVWVLTAGAAHYYRAALGAAEIARMVGRLRAGLDPRRGAAPGGAEPYPLALAAELYRRLFAPARAMLDGISHVIYLPDGALRDLPLSVLVVDLAEPLGAAGGGPGGGAEPGGGDGEASRPEFARYREVVWVIDKYAVSQIPSLDALRVLRSGAAARRPLADASKLRGLQALPQTAAKAPKPEGYRPEGYRPEGYRTVAFAIRGNDAGVGEPLLVMTPPARAAGDGLLSAGEIARLDLDADLVVLGGAGAPDGKAGSDWLSGLAGAFFHAGARALMVSRWPVEPVAAAALTAGMLARRDAGAPGGMARLLQRSALEMLNDETRPARFAHPMNWGAFTIIGDGRRLD